MIIEATNYFAKPGLADEVLAHRRNGNAVRAAMGLKPGRILKRIGDKGPDVRWECEFADQAEFDADMAARDRSPEFAVQRQRMGELTDKFERHVLHVDTP